MKFLLVIALFYLSCTTNAKNLDPVIDHKVENVNSDQESHIEMADKHSSVMREEPKTSNQQVGIQEDNSRLEEIKVIENPFTILGIDEITEVKTESTIAPEETKPTEPSTEDVLQPVLDKNDDSLEIKEESRAVSDIVIAVEEELSTIADKVDHSILDQLLQKYVSKTGFVDYAGLSRNRAQLNLYLTNVSAQIPDGSWSREESLAYWINVYNAYTIDLILTNYPVSSIMDLDNGNPWEVKRINLDGKKYSLNQIEHEIIRPQFKDPRIHFAVNCAAMSCPKLHYRAMTAANVDGTLNSLTKEFINNSAQNIIGDNRAQLSKIFEWYAVDFGNLMNYINRYASTKLDIGANVSYREYDWKLNGE